MDAPDVSVVVLAYGPEPWLEACVDAVLASTGVAVELLLVDNGCSNPAVPALGARAGVRLLTPGDNLGFAGGCNHGAAQARGEVLALVNSDAIAAPDALARLAAVARREDVGIASGSIRLAETPDLLNSAGNPVHLTGLTWAGAFGEPAAAHDREVPVASASGAGMAIRRARWEELGGFDPAYFAYLEDTELSLRCWQRGWRVLYVPDAVVAHHYEFSRNPRKYHLLERNRLAMVLTLLEARTLLVLAPVLLAFEVAMAAASLAQGWWPEKRAGWAWLWRNRRRLAARRRLLQAERSVPDRDLLHLLEARIEPANLGLPAGAALGNALLGGYWAGARWLLARTDPRQERT